MRNILTVSGVGIRMGERLLYSGVDLTLHQGETLALTGENGVGKTTLVRAIMGQLTPTYGQIIWPTGMPVISYVPQYRAEADAFGLRIRDFVALSFDHGLLPWLRQVERDRLAAVLRRTGLTKIGNRRIDTASGGERQRAYLAQALLRNPQLLILDEATANLDTHAKFQLMDLVQEEQKRSQLSVLMVSHDPEIVKQYADVTVHLAPDAKRMEAAHV
jgi:zinc/manganese transport system ATP-binding protein